MNRSALRADSRASTPSRDRTEPSLAAIEGSLAQAHAIIHELELRVANLGVPIAPLYLASARGSLRHVSVCIESNSPRCPGSAEADEIVFASGILLRPSDCRAGVGTRFRMVNDRALADPGAELPARPARPDLGADLLRCAGASSLCGGPVGATLVFAALAHHRWLHLPTRTKWSTDVSGARALVAALAGGGTFDVPTSGAVMEVADSAVADLLAGIGWTRMISIPMPGGA